VYASYSIDGGAFRDCTSFTTTAPSYSISKKDCYKRCIRQFETQYDCSEASWADWVIDTTVCGDEDSYSFSSELSTSNACKKLYIKKGSKRCVDFVDLDVSCTGISYPSKPSQTPMGCCPGWFVYVTVMYLYTDCTGCIGTYGWFSESYISNPSEYFNICDPVSATKYMPLDGPYNSLEELRAAHNFCESGLVTTTAYTYSSSDCTGTPRSGGSYQESKSPIYIDLLSYIGTDFWANGCAYYSPNRSRTLRVTFDSCN